MSSDSSRPPGAGPDLVCPIPFVDVANPPLILVVDDDEVIRDMLARRLEQRGYATRQVSNGTEALALLDQQLFDLVLLDVQMPAMSGYEVLQRIRLTQPAGLLPVIMVTGRDRSQDVVEALALGANDYVVKPIDVAVTLARIDTQLARRRAELRAREVEARYAAAVAGATDGIWDWTFATNAWFCSDVWKVRFGCGVGEPSPTVDAWFERIHEADQKRVRGEIDAHIAGLSAHLQVEYRMRDATNMYRWVVTRGLIVRDGDGRPIRLAGSFTDVTEAKESDTLTSLSSRVLFIERLGRCLEVARRRNLAMATLLLEVQGLRAINDTHGRSMGDRVLVGVARRLEHVLRANRHAGGSRRTASESRQTLARLDGHEFAMLIPDIEGHAALTQLAEEIQDAFARPFALGEQDVYVTASIGMMASFAGYPGPEEVLRDLGIALSRAKGLGKSAYAMFEPGMRDRALVRQQVEVELRPALERGEFRLFYQPVLRLDRETVVGFEALLRWEHPDRGLLQPDTFVPLAEDSDLILPVGRWVLREACRQLATWRRDGVAERNLRVSVNLCAREFQQPDLVPYVSGLLDEYDVEEQQLEIEVTERTAMSNEPLAIERLAQLRACGVSVCLDDFGAGHSSLAYLHRFPVDRLKIDRSFIARLMEVGDADSRPIVRAVLAMARDMGIDAVAEGVEGIDQFDLLCGLSCRLGQGYLFSRPVDADAATGILRNGLRFADWQMGQPSLLDGRPEKSALH